MCCTLFWCRPRKNALFLVDLLLDSHGVHYSTSLPSFESTLISLFDKGILSTHNVPQLEKVTFASPYNNNNIFLKSLMCGHTCAHLFTISWEGSDVWSYLYPSFHYILGRV